MQVQEDKADRISITNGRDDQSAKNEVRYVREREQQGEAGSDYSQYNTVGHLEREWDDLIY
jgi:hypothetical protein